MSAPPFPGTSGLAALKSATASSMPLHRRERSNGSQSEKFDAVYLQLRVERISPLRRTPYSSASRGEIENPGGGHRGFGADDQRVRRSRLISMCLLFGVLRAMTSDRPSL